MNARGRYRWWTLILVIVAVIAMALTQLIPYPDPHLAGANWSSTVTFVYPTMLASIVIAVIGSIRAGLLQPWTTRGDRLWNIGSLALGLSPMVFMVFLVTTMLERHRRTDAMLKTYF